MPVTKEAAWFTRVLSVVMLLAISAPVTATESAMQAFRANSAMAPNANDRIVPAILALPLHSLCGPKSRPAIVNNLLELDRTAGLTGALP